MLDNYPEVANAFGREPVWVSTLRNEGDHPSPEKSTLTCSTPGGTAAATAGPGMGRKELSLMQFVMERANDPMLLTMLLSVRTQISLQPNIFAEQALSVAIKLGVRRPVQLLLGAMPNPNFSQTAGSLEVLASCFPELSTKYPQARAALSPCLFRSARPYTRSLTRPSF